MVHVLPNVGVRQLLKLLVHLWGLPFAQDQLIDKREPDYHSVGDHYRGRVEPVEEVDSRVD